MKNEQTIKDIYYMAGILETLSCLQGQTVTEAMVYILADCVDRLELIGTRLLAEDVKPREGTEEADWPKPYQ